MIKAAFLSFLAMAFFSPTNMFAQGNETNFINKTSGIRDSIPSGYVPPLISNGSLNMLVDYRGCQGQTEYVKMIPCIYWAGRRYGPPNDALIPFGHFDQELKINGKVYALPTRWEQTLDTRNAVATCINDYGEELTVETKIFVHLIHNLVVVKKKFTSRSPSVKNLDFSFRYYFTPPGTENVVPRRVISQGKMNGETKGIDFLFTTDGYKATKGIISLFAGQDGKSSFDGQIASISSHMAVDSQKPAEICYYLLMEDSMDGENFMERAEKLQMLVREQESGGMLASHQQEWAKYWNESFVKLPDQQMEKVYNTAQYHLRANATKWSFPVGIFTTHWAGKYFGWDEMFCFQALASSNHLDISKRCPEFRFAVLPKAQYRVAHYGKPGIYGARYPWETLEDGGESVPTGFWIDHVFHMSNIALSSWFQYLYSGDTDYLKTTGYPVIRDCARFYFSHMVYKNPDGSMYIGKCTDLERLGPDKQNPFMTACGVIYTFENAASAASILKIDREEAVKWKQAAIKLKENLPAENGMYVPYLGCQEKSVASLGGLFPYPLFTAADSLQRKAAYDFVSGGRSSGNMYPVGTSVCAWYAGWMAASLALLGDRKEPSELLSEASRYAGCFSELFEINEPKVAMHPWFSTASGNYVYALNQMLVQSKDDQILIAPAIPENWQDLSFKLACYGNMTATVSIKKGKISQLILTPGNNVKECVKTLTIPERYFDKTTLKKVKLPVEKTNDGFRIKVSLKEETILIGS